MVNFYLLRGLSRQSALWETFPKAFLGRFSNSPVIEMDLLGLGMLKQINSPISHINDILRQIYYSTRGFSIFKASPLTALVVIKWVKQKKYDFQGPMLISPCLKGICKLPKCFILKSWYACVVKMLHLSVWVKKKKLLKIIMNDLHSQVEFIDHWIIIHHLTPYKTRNIFLQMIDGIKFIYQLNPWTSKC